MLSVHCYVASVDLILAHYSGGSQLLRATRQTPCMSARPMTERFKSQEPLFLGDSEQILRLGVHVHLGHRDCVQGDRQLVQTE